MGTKTAEQIDMGKRLLELVARKLDGASANIDLVTDSLQLIKDGADLTQRDSAGRTALMLTAHFFRPRIFEQLLKCDESLHLRDNAGLNVFDHDRRLKRNVLRQAMLQRANRPPTVVSTGKAIPGMARPRIAPRQTLKI